MRIRSFSSLVLSVALAGCSTHPLPKDVTKENTASIVRNVRCEAKFKVIERVRDLLEDSPIQQVRAIPPKDVLREENLALIAARHPAGSEYTDKNGVERKYKNLALIFTAFRSSVIGYSFDFLITENNDAKGNADFKMPFTNGLFKFGFGGEINKIRAAQRKFVMQETFDDLRKLRCRDDSEFFAAGHKYKSLRKKLIYPLTGSVGMGEIMNTFLDLGALGGKPGSLFTDVLTFTTTLKGDIGATVGMTSFPPKKFRLLSADASAAAGRVDVHKVTITLAFPTIEHRNMQILRLDTKKRENVEARTLELVALESCIQSSNRIEVVVGALRDFAPEQYCPKFAANLTDLRLGSSSFRRRLDPR